MFPKTRCADICGYTYECQLPKVCTRPLTLGEDHIAARSLGWQVEERAEGQVARSVYLAYFSSWGSMLVLPAGMLAFFTAERALQVQGSFQVGNPKNIHKLVEKLN